MKKRNDEENNELKCSFCKRGQNETGGLIHGYDGYICEDCVLAIADAVYNIRKKRKENNISLGAIVQNTPAKFKSELDKYVIGQEYAKKTVSVAIYNHYKRIKYNLENKNKIRKTNLLFFGPTGVGKTFLAEIIAKFISVPFAIADATSITEAGYVGEDVENVLLKLVENANYNIKNAELGIIYIDEIDKIAKSSDNTSITRDVSGEGVQQALLKLIESTIANLPPKGGRKHPDQKYIKINTENILFIFGGAFVGLEDIVQRRIGKKTLGFGQEIIPKGEYRDISKAKPEDFVKYGLIPEFIGRIPILVPFENLDESMLIRVMKEPKNSLLKEYQKMLSLDDCNLLWEEDALKCIAKIVHKQKTGARGLKGIIESVLMDVMYEVPSIKGKKKCVVNKKSIKEGNPLEIIKVE
ncbi:ATP-dependent Clp protease ATP-binding subunit ClpX [candidate division TA06 bacterium]|mgnify:FL=1|uniref:ATP-dependent Clp protease ATP-binding subunit ClpX n=1 Tax=candidate division TA06 bacterium TaxID=2250710 RepID=A0A660SN53_UNCT6|nr:MAG: ATP-dependent Clp protease ATP-binding subunit ClpX [candidate division TA06 bacterium]